VQLISSFMYVQSSVINLTRVKNDSVMDRGFD